MEISNEYLIKYIRKFNRIEKISDDLQFVKEEVEREQCKIVEKWLLGKIPDKTAKERIKALRWFLQWINQIQKVGKNASEIMEKRNVPPPIS